MAQDEEKTTFFSRRVVSLRSIGSTAVPEIRLQEQDVHTLGRAPENSIVIENDTVSRRHAELRCVNGRFVIRDFGSGNGIVVSGRRVQEQELADGDQLELGECVLEFRDSATAREQTNGQVAAEPFLTIQRPQPPRPTQKATQRSGADGYRFPRVSRKAGYLGLAGGGAVLVALVLVLAFRGMGHQEAVHQPSPPVPAPVRPPTVSASGPKLSEEIEQRLSKASAQYQAGLLGQALEEYRRAIEAGATDQDVRRTYEQIAKEFEHRLQDRLTQADEYEKRLQFREAITELQGALALIGETSDARLAEIQARVSRLQ